MIPARRHKQINLVSAAPALEIIDYRNQAHPLPVLQRLLAEAPVDQIKVWAEAEANVRLSQVLGGIVFDRGRLSACERLVIWTTPPGWAELRDVLACTRPRQVVVFAVDPGLDQPQAFLERLAGLAKHVLSKQDGRASLARLASATAQKDWTVRLGLEWLAAMGHIRIIPTDETTEQGSAVEEKGEVMKITPGGLVDSSQAVLLLEQIQTLLEETHAYRAYFLNRDPLKLIA